MPFIQLWQSGRTHRLGGSRRPAGTGRTTVELGMAAEERRSGGQADPFLDRILQPARPRARERPGVRAASAAAFARFTAPWVDARVRVQVSPRGWGVTLCRGKRAHRADEGSASKAVADATRTPGRFAQFVGQGLVRASPRLCGEISGTASTDPRGTGLFLRGARGILAG